MKYNSQPALEEWHAIANKAKWKTPADITSEIANARYLGSDRFSFKIKGNRYRLVIEVNFTYQIIYIRFIGTHAEYDKINAIVI